MEKQSNFEKKIIEVKIETGKEKCLEYQITENEIYIIDNESNDEYKRIITKEESNVIMKYIHKSINIWDEKKFKVNQENRIWHILVKEEDGKIIELSGTQLPELWDEFMEGLTWLMVDTNTADYDENFIKVLIYIVLAEQNTENQKLSICRKYMMTSELLQIIYDKFPENHQVRVLFNSIFKLQNILFLKVWAETKIILNSFVEKFPQKDELKDISDTFDIDDLAEEIMTYAKDTKLLNSSTERKETDVIETNLEDNEITYSNNYNELKKMNFSPEIESLLSPLAIPSIRGLRCAFVGEDGTDKENAIKNVATYLFKIGKISTSRLELLNLKNNFSIKEDRLYYISDIQDFAEEFENNDDFSDEAKLKSKYNKVIVKKLINQINGKYIIIDCTPFELRRFLAINSKLPYIFDTEIFFNDLENNEILKLLEDSLPNYHKKMITEDVRNEILEYIDRNRKYFPFKNKDLSIYLSTYISKKEKIDLPKERYNEKTLEEMFNDLIGMDNVKRQLNELKDFLKLQSKLEKQGKTIPNFNLNMMFLGNAGTGKTTVARMVAKILFDLGYINENKLIEVEAKDLIAPYSGQTPLKTGRVINSAIGGVLFIDEAYSLVQASGTTGEEAISTLVKAMEDYKGELVVILAGYSKEMQEFIRANSGIQSRIGYTFEFADYTEEELYKIYELKAHKIGFSINDEAEKKIREIINFGRNRRNFGNGRYIDNILQKTLTKQATLNLDDKDILNLTEDSIPTIEEILTQVSGERNPNCIERLFDEIVGMESIKKEIIALGKYAQFRNKLAKTAENTLPDMRLHMLFSGDAGTGKTTMARKITEMLYNIGCIRINKLVEVERKDLVGEHIGETAPKTEKVIESALGGVLFIDEAYSLTPKNSSMDYGQEAISTLIKAMEDHKDELVVIFAGYTKEMKDFVNSNSGIASRIGYTFIFENYTDEELYKIFEIKCKKYSLKVNKSAKEKIMEVLKYFSSVENFGNGRFVDKLLQEILIKHSMNEKLEENINKIMVEDIPTIKEMVEKTFSNEENLVIPADIDKETRRKIAIHELGHAIIHYIYQGETNLKVITVIPEGTGALGYVLHTIPKSKVIWTKRDYLDEIEELLAGRAAEDIFLGEDKVSSGCWNDLEKVANKITNLFNNCGMSETLGLISAKNIKPSLEMQQKLDAEKKKVLDSCYENVKYVLKNNKNMFDKVLDTLMKKGTITGEEFTELVKNK